MELVLLLVKLSCDLIKSPNDIRRVVDNHISVEETAQYGVCSWQKHWHRQVRLRDFLIFDYLKDHLCIKMNEDNMIRILLPAVSDLGHGVKASEGGKCPSKVFGCHMFGENLRYGFIYRNGSNSRIAYKNEEDVVEFGTIHRGQCVIMFATEVTTRGIRRLQAGDFHRDWFDEEARQLVRDQLKAFEDKDNEISGLIDLLQDFTITEIQKLKKTAEEMKHPIIQ